MARPPKRWDLTKNRLDDATLSQIERRMDEGQEVVIKRYERGEFEMEIRGEKDSLDGMVYFWVFGHNAHPEEDLYSYEAERPGGQWSNYDKAQSSALDALEEINEDINEENVEVVEAETVSSHEIVNADFVGKAYYVKVVFDNRDMAGEARRLADVRASEAGWDTDSGTQGFPSLNDNGQYTLSVWYDDRK